MRVFPLTSCHPVFNCVGPTVSRKARVWACAAPESNGGKKYREKLAVVSGTIIYIIEYVLCGFTLSSVGIIGALAGTSKDKSNRLVMLLITGDKVLESTVYTRDE